MEKYVTLLEDGTNTQVHLPTLNTSGSGNGASDGAFFKAVLCVRRSVDAKRQSVSSNSNTNIHWF